MKRFHQGSLACVAVVKWKGVDVWGLEGGGSDQLYGQPSHPGLEVAILL